MSIPSKIPPHFCDVVPDECPIEIPRKATDKSGKPLTLTGAWLYPAVGNTPPLLHVRYDGESGKSLPWYYQCANDEWKPGRNNSAAPLYGTETIRAGEPVVVCEGEKSASSLHSLGVAAVAFDGTGAAASVDLSPLEDVTDPILWPDNDEPGRKAMDTLTERLVRAHRRVDPEILELGHKKDAADLVNEYLWSGQRVTTAAQLWQALHTALKTVEAPSAPAAPESMGRRLSRTWLTDHIPPLEHVFKHDIIPMDRITFLTAHGGTGKSFLTLQWAASVATGRNLMGVFEPTAGPSRVAIIGVEDDYEEVMRRMQRIGHAYNIGYDDRDVQAVADNVLPFCLTRFAIASETPERTLAASPEMKRITAELAEFAPRLIIMDPLSGLLGGLVDENSSETAYVIAGILRESLPKGCGLVMCCHTAKTDVLTATAPKGSVGWWNSARQALSLRPVSAADEKILGDDAANVVVFEMGKSNSGPKSPPIHLRRCMLPEFGGVLRPMDMADAKCQAVQSRTAGLADSMLATLAEFPVTRQEVKGDCASDAAKERSKAFLHALEERLGKLPTKEDRLLFIDTMKADGRIDTRKESRREVLVVAGQAEIKENQAL